MTDSHWLIALRPDGIVVEASGGAPTSWRGENLRESTVVPASICAAASQLLEEARHASAELWLFRATVPAEGERPATELLVIEAVPLRREATRLNELLTRTTETLVEQARATRVLLRVEADEGMPQTLPIDGEKIAWGVAALVGSALRHVANSPSREKRIDVEARYDERERAVVVSVSDNGPGIPTQKLQWLVTRDPRTQQAAGLALVLLKDVVAAHGGRMEVESSTDAKRHGTKVTLYLPIA